MALFIIFMHSCKIQQMKTTGSMETGCQCPVGSKVLQCLQWKNNLKKIEPEMSSDGLKLIHYLNNLTIKTLFLFCNVCLQCNVGVFHHIISY